MLPRAWGLPMDGSQLEQKIAVLDARLAELAPLAVAFSGGVDSSVLLHAAARVLGPKVRALIADSPSLPRAELAEARELARALGVELVELSTSELSLDAYAANAGDRCYWCRRTLFDAMTDFACEHGFAHLAYGEIVDDLTDDRPGRRAAREFAVSSPLVTAGLTKEDVRAYARRYGLGVADKPAQACLASRIPVGTRVTPERLARVEHAEEALREFAFQVLRVRDHGARARVEVAEGELGRARERRDEIAARLRRMDFLEVEFAVYGTARPAFSAHPASAGRSAADLRGSRAPGN